MLMLSETTGQWTSIHSVPLYFNKVLSLITANKNSFNQAWLGHNNLNYPMKYLSVVSTWESGIKSPHCCSLTSSTFTPKPNEKAAARQHLNCAYSRNPSAQLHRLSTILWKGWKKKLSFRGADFKWCELSQSMFFQPDKPWRKMDAHAV